MCISAVLLLRERSLRVPMPSCFAFSSAALAAILAASRESVGRLLVADILKGCLEVVMF